MNALFVVIVVLGIIFLVMICNSNKDGYVPMPQCIYTPININQNDLPDICEAYHPLCGLDSHDCRNLQTLTSSQIKCLHCVDKRNDVHKKCVEAGGSRDDCVKKYLDCQQSCQ